MRVGLTTTAIFGDLSGYYFGMTWNDIEWLFHVKIRFRPALIESERLNIKK